MAGRVNKLNSIEKNTAAAPAVCGFAKSYLTRVFRLMSRKWSCYWLSEFSSLSVIMFDPALRHHTTLADYIWDLQCPDTCYERGEEECDQSIDYDITWRILARAPGYNPVTGMCRLCLKESFLILFHPETASLNKKTEIYQGCKHKQFKFLADCKVTWNLIYF